MKHIFGVLVHTFFIGHHSSGFKNTQRDGNVLVSRGCNSEEAEAASLFQNGVLCEDITASMQAMHPQLDASKAMACACEYNLCNDFEVCDACTADGKTENCKKIIFGAIL